MAQAPKLTAEQWADARAVWERDERDGYAWLVRELSLPVTAPGVRKRALSEGWAKGAKPAASREKPTGRAAKKPAAAAARPAPSTKKPRREKPAPETLAEKPETIETMGEEAWDAMDAESEASDTSSSSGRTRARIAPGGVADPVIGELLRYDHGNIDDLLATPSGGYESRYARIAYKFFLLGATVEQLADALCVCKTTIYNWAQRHPEFDMALRGGRELADANVASRLYARAMGYSHDEEVIKVTAEGQVIRVPTVKHYPPDPGAAIFWLKNRQPSLWRERVEVQEQPTIALVDKQAMNEVLQRALDHAAEVKRNMAERPARLGLTIDQGEDGGD